MCVSRISLQVARMPSGFLFRVFPYVACCKSRDNVLNNHLINSTPYEIHRPRSPSSTDWTRINQFRIVCLEMQRNTSMVTT